MRLITTLYPRKCFQIQWERRVTSKSINAKKIESPVNAEKTGTSSGWGSVSSKRLSSFFAEECNRSGGKFDTRIRGFIDPP